MQTTGRTTGLAFTLLVLSAGPARAQADDPPPEARPGAIAVEVTGFRSDKGLALVGLYASAKGFPNKTDKALRRVQVAIHGRKASAVFRDLPPGTYAIAVLHDEDVNYKMKTGFLGIPKEGYGTSRDARARFGPPRFDDARLALHSSQTIRAPIRLVYH